MSKAICTENTTDCQAVNGSAQLCTPVSALYDAYSSDQQSAWVLCEASMMRARGES
jgi:hypothetical protein